MNTPHENRIPELVRLKLEGHSYGEIRKDLQADGMNDEEISLLIREVDKQVLKKELEGSKTEKARSVYFAGLALAVLGLILALAYNAGLILEGSPALLVYAPFLLGVLVMLTSKRLPRKEEKPEPGSGAIRKQRPYK